jgi:hypothetical protein
MGTFMSKHCSPMSYGTPLEKKSCATLRINKLIQKAICSIRRSSKEYRINVKRENKAL